MLRVRFFEPSEGFLFLAHGNVRHNMHRCRMRLPTPAQLLPFRQRTPSLRLLARATVDIGLHLPDGRIVTVVPFLYLRLGLREHSFFYIRKDHYVGAREARFHSEHGAKLLDGAVILAGGAKEYCLVRGDDQRLKNKLPPPLTPPPTLIATAPAALST